MKFKILKNKETGMYSAAKYERCFYFWEKWPMLGHYGADKTKTAVILEDKFLSEWLDFTPVSKRTEKEMLLFLKKWWDANKPKQEHIAEYETVRIIDSKELEKE